MNLKCEIYRDSMQNYKKYAIPRAQLVIADVPYNVGNNFYGSNPMWYTGGDNKNGESKLAGKAAFNSDFNFNLYEYFHFCSKMLRKEPKKAGARGRSSDAPCMIVFCSFEQPIFIARLWENVYLIKKQKPFLIGVHLWICQRKTMETIRLMHLMPVLWRAGTSVLMRLQEVK